MARNTKKADLDELRKESEKLYTLLVHEENDRAAVLLGAAFLDDWLDTLLRAFLVDDMNAVDELVGGDRGLGSFSSRITAAYCLGLISRDTYRDLHLIRQIRNDFAHVREDISFSTDRVRDRCLSLSIGMESDLHRNAGHRFKFAVACISVVLIDKSIHIAHREANTESMHWRTKFTVLVANLNALRKEMEQAGFDPAQSFTLRGSLSTLSWLPPTRPPVSDTSSDKS